MTSQNIEDHWYIIVCLANGERTETGRCLQRAYQVWQSLTPAQMQRADEHVRLHLRGVRNLYDSLMLGFETWDRTQDESGAAGWEVPDRKDLLEVCKLLGDDVFKLVPALVRVWSDIRTVCDAEDGGGEVDQFEKRDCETEVGQCEESSVGDRSGDGFKGSSVEDEGGKSPTEVAHLKKRSVRDLEEYATEVREASSDEYDREVGQFEGSSVEDDREVAGFKGSSVEDDREVAGFKGSSVEDDRKVAGFKGSSIEDNREVAGFKGSWVEDEREVAGFKGSSVEDDREVAGFKGSSVEDDREVAGFKGSSVEDDGEVAGFKGSSVEDDREVAGFKGSSVEDDREVAGFKGSSVEDDREVAGFKGSSVEDDGEVAGFKGSSVEDGREVTGFKGSSVEDDREVTGFKGSSVEDDREEAGFKGSSVEDEGKGATEVDHFKRSSRDREECVTRAGEFEKRSSEDVRKSDKEVGRFENRLVEGDRKGNEGLATSQKRSVGDSVECATQVGQLLNNSVEDERKGAGFSLQEVPTKDSRKGSEEIGACIIAHKSRSGFRKEYEDVMGCEDIYEDSKGRNYNLSEDDFSRYKPQATHFEPLENTKAAKLITVNRVDSMEDLSLDEAGHLRNLQIDNSQDADFEKQISPLSSDEESLKYVLGKF